MTDAAGKSRLAQTLEAGHFALTAETTPPASGDADDVLFRAAPLKGLADAVNVTDGAGARAHLSSLIAAQRLLEAGIEPILQMTCRDRNRLALQSDLLGAGAIGVRNILCLTGDDPTSGDEPEAQAVNDLSSGELIKFARRMSDHGTLGSGREIHKPPRFFIGGADMPIDPPADWQPTTLLAKIEAGINFVQTQYCFDVERARRYLARLTDFGIPEQIHILVGIGPLRSARQARWMRENLYGVEIGEDIVDRLQGARDGAAEGRHICLELIARFREIPGIAGVHLMAPSQEAEIARTISESGLLSAREQPKGRE